VADALALVQLTGREVDYPRELSGGQQQRSRSRAALVFEPRLLLLDEPLGALDRMLREHMKLELRRVHRELGTTMIYVTHDQDEALVLSDRIMVMNNAGIAQIGTPQEIYERPATPFVARFIGESNFLGGTISAVSGGVAAVALENGGVAYGTARAPSRSAVRRSSQSGPKRSSSQPPAIAARPCCPQRRRQHLLRRSMRLRHRPRRRQDADVKDIRRTDVFA